jgi:hypothetical protein
MCAFEETRPQRYNAALSSLQRLYRPELFFDDPKGTTTVWPSTANGSAFHRNQEFKKWTVNSISQHFSGS